LNLDISYPALLLGLHLLAAGCRGESGLRIEEH
jgi:hypothetical protein